MWHPRFGRGDSPNLCACLLLKNAFVVPGTFQAVAAFVQLKAGMLAQVEEESNAALPAIAVDPAFQFFPDQPLQIGEVLQRENECRASLLFRFRRSEDIVRTAIALGYGRHPVFLAEDTRFGAPDLMQASAAQFDGIVVNGRQGGIGGHDLR